MAGDDRSGASMPGRAGSSNRATHCPGASGPQNADEYVHMNVFFCKRDTLFLIKVNSTE